VTFEEWREGVASSEITEVFACGTAAVLTPIGMLKWRTGQVSCGEQAGPVTLELRQRLVDVQYGRAADSFGWMQQLV
jgi:branched-chain amino acid aminotransferase